MVGDLRTEAPRVALKPANCGKGSSASLACELWGPGAVDGRLSRLCAEGGDGGGGGGGRGKGLWWAEVAESTCCDDDGWCLSAPWGSPTFMACMPGGMTPVACAGILR